MESLSLVCIALCKIYLFANLKMYTAVTFETMIQYQPGHRMLMPTADKTKLGCPVGGIPSATATYIHSMIDIGDTIIINPINLIILEILEEEDLVSKLIMIVFVEQPLAKPVGRLKKTISKTMEHLDC